jgi:hypothetical protein
MGAKTMMLAYTDGDAISILKSQPVLDPVATQALVAKLFPEERLSPLDETTLCDTYPADKEVLAASFPGLNILASRAFGIDYPSTLPARFIDPQLGRTIYLHAMHSVVDWFAFAIWVDGKLVRALSLSPDSGILEDIGERLPFELPYWEGAHSIFGSDEEDNDYPFPFHPLEMGEAALKAMFGYQIEGMVESDDVQPDEIPLTRFVPSKPWWKVW